VDGDNDRGGSLALPGAGVWVKESSGEYADVLGVEDRLREAREQFVRVFREEGDGERVNGELGFVGGEAKGQPGRVSHWERLIELGGEGVEVGREGCRGSGRVGDE